MPSPTASPTARSFAANQHGRDFVIGDLHGHFEMLETLLVNRGFCPSTDRVFCTGDLIDRGPYSEHVVRWLAYPWFAAVRGNHEQMVLDHITGTGDAPRHARNGGAWFYALPVVRQRAIAEAILQMPLAIDVALRDGRTIGVIHAESPGWERQLDWQQALAWLSSEQPEARRAALQQAMYARTKIVTQNPTPVVGVDTLYVGHSTVPQILTLGNVQYIDTGCSFADGHLSAIELDSQQVFCIGPSASNA